MANTVQVGSIQEGRFYVKGSEGQLIEIKSGDEISIGYNSSR